MLELSHREVGSQRGLLSFLSNTKSTQGSEDMLQEVFGDLKGPCCVMN